MAKRAANKVETIGDFVLKEIIELENALGVLSQDMPESYMESLSELGVLDGLPHHQREGLAGIVAKCYARGDDVRWFDSARRDRHVWAKEGPRRLRVLKKKMAKAQHAIHVVLDQLKKFDLTYTRDDMREALAVLAPESLRNAERFVSSMKPGLRRNNERVALTLYDFFVASGLKKNEAEVRVAKIGNHFWDWNLPVTERYSGRGEDWKGCPAVRQLIARNRKRPKNTPHKST